MHPWKEYPLPATEIICNCIEKIKFCFDLFDKNKTNKTNKRLQKIKHPHKNNSSLNSSN